MNEDLLAVPNASNGSSSSSNNLLEQNTNVAFSSSMLQPTPSHVGSESLHSANTHTTTTETNSITYQAKILLTNSIITLQDCEAKKGWKNYSIFLFVNVYWMWCLIFMTTLSDFKWGHVGSYILIDAFNFPTTLIARMIPYLGVVGIGSVFIAIILIMAVFYVISIRLANKQNKYYKKLKYFTFYCALIVKPFSLLFVYVLLGFLNCSSTMMMNDADESTDMIASLMRYPNQACIDDTTNLIMLILSIISILVLVTFVFPLSEFITCNSNPESQIPMLIENPFIFSLIGSLSILQLVLSQLLPTNYIFISAIFHLLISLICCVLVFYSMPCLRRFENSLYFGVMSARVGASIGSLVSSLVNSSSITSSSSDSERANFEMMGIAFSLMTLALIIIFFTIGTLTMELYQRLQLKRARDMILNGIEGHENYGTISPLSLIEKNAMNLYYMFEDFNKLSLLKLFIKSCLSNSTLNKSSNNNSNSTENNQILKDCELAMSFIRGAAHQKSFNNVDLLIYSALLIQTQWLDSNNCVFSMSLLKRASSQHPNIFQQFKIREKMKQIESFNLKSKSTSNSFELTSQLDILEKNQNNLLVLHRNFWKEMASERINYSSVEKINRSIYALTTQCRNTLQNLIFNNKNNKTLLRLYGNFLENFEFNSELAQYYYNEASSIEEEEIKKRRKASFANNTVNKRGNRIMPLVSEVKNTYEMYLAQEEPNEDDMASAFENPKIKKEQIFKNAISSQRSNTLTLSITCIYALVVVALFVASLALSAYYSNMVKSGVPYLQQVCQPSISPYSVLRNIRATQNFINTFMFFEYPWPNTYQGYETLSKTEYIKNSYKRLQDNIDIYKNLIKLSQSNSFDVDVYSDYSANIYTCNFPNENSKDLNLYDLGSASQKNISILEFTNHMIKYTQNMIDTFPINLLTNISSHNYDPSYQTLLLNIAATDLYFHPLKNYNFMFLFANRETASLAFDTFCARYLDRSTDAVDLTTQNLVYYSGAVLVAFFLISIAYLSYMIFEMSHMTKIVKIYEKHLSKDVIGKIFHSLNNKTTDTANNADNTFSLAKMKSNISTIILISLITLFTCASIAMFYYESDFNAQTAGRVMNNVRLSIQAATSVQRIAFNTGEVMTYFVASEISNNISPLAVNFKRNVTYGDPRLFNTVTNFNVLFDRATNRLPTLSSMWSRLIYGDASVGTRPILGMYPGVDSLINHGVSSNCSDYLQENNMTLTIETNMMYCIGLETLLNDYMTLVPQLLTDSRKQNSLQKAATPKGILLPIADLGIRHNLAMRMALALSNKFTIFIKAFISSSTAPSYDVVISFAGVEIVGCMVFFFLMYIIYSNYCGQLHSLRLMSQYIPVEVLERNETLRNFILYNNTNSLSTRMKKKDKSSSSSASSISDLKNVFNSSVEGSIICNENHEIEFLNYSALKMFGMKPIDVLGTSISQLVESTHQDELNKCIKYIFKKSGKDSDKKDEDQDDEDVQLKQSSKESEEGNGKCEIVELDCIRRNQTKFPCKITLFTVKIQGERGSMRNILIVTMKDLTSEKKQNALLSEEKQKSDNLLKNILPTSVASRLKSGHTFIAEKLDDITCFFSDMVGFTAISSNMQATDLVMMLNSIVNGFDMLTEKYDLEKIKTIGDAYFAVGGLPGAATSDHPERVLKFAIETFGVINDFNSNRLKSVDNNEQEEVVKETDNELKVKSSSPPPQQINIRVGINTGSVVAGVIGMKKFAYDLWGDTINIASRMESTSKNGRIQISRSTYERVFDLGYDFEEREVDVKGKGIVKTYLLNDKHHRHLKNNPLLYSNNRSVSDLFANTQ